MRITSQLAVLAVVAGAAMAGWLWQDRLLGLIAQPAQSRGPGPGATRTVPVEVAKAQSREIQSVVEAVGTSLANEAITVTVKVSGLVRRIAFREGQQVNAGTILVELDAGEIEAKIQELRAARDNARLIHERAQTLLATRNVPQAKAEESEAQLNMAEARLRAEQAKLADAVIRAPFSGRLGLRHVSIGALVKPGDPITTLDDTSVIKLDFEIPELALAGVRVGGQASARSLALPGREFIGQITTIDSRVDPVTRSVRVRANIPNADEVLKPGMFLTVNVVTDRRLNAVVIPEEAIIAVGGQQYVFAIAGNRAIRTRVVTGQRLPGTVEIVEGLAAGTDVVVGGLQHVRDGSPVQIIGQPPMANSPKPGSPS